MFEHRLHLWEEVGGLELLHGVVSACDADEAKLGAALIPVVEGLGVEPRMDTNGHEGG